MNYKEMSWKEAGICVVISIAGITLLVYGRNHGWF